MNTTVATGPRISVPTWIGLVIALFGALIVRWAVNRFYPEFSVSAMLWKEELIWLCVIALLVVIFRGERLSLRSINIGTASIVSSTLSGILPAVLLGLISGLVVTLTHFHGGPMGAAFAKLPHWLVIIVVIRAGVVEELFYRGYAIERLRQLGLNRFLSGLIPLLIFGFAHGTNGWANVILALALGAVLTIFYLWRRDLVANMIGHFLIDFTSIVLPRFVRPR
jgi:CAAX protease family protein